MSSRSTSSSSPPAIELRKETLSTIKKPSVWSIDEETRNVQPVPTTAQPSLIDGKCDRNTTEDGVCCKDFKKVDRTLINPDIIRDVIIGLSDGLTVPFALTAGLSSLGESKLVVLGGVAELIAGALSMGIGGFLASQAERDHYRYLRQHTLQRVHRSCAGEIEREVLGVLGPVGVDEPTCRAVARSLHDVEDHTPEGGYQNVNGHPVDDREALGIRMSKDAGLTAFFVKFGQGLEEIPNKRMYISAFTIGMGYLLGGIIPLLPYFFVPKAHIALIYSSVVTGVILLIFGVVKARITGAAQRPTDYVWGAFSTLMVGGLAAAAAFGIVRALEKSGHF